MIRWRRRSPSACRARLGRCARAVATATSTRSCTSRSRGPRAFRRAWPQVSPFSTGNSITMPGRRSGSSVGSLSIRRLASSRPTHRICDSRSADWASRPSSCVSWARCASTFSRRADRRRTFFPPSLSMISLRKLTKRYGSFTAVDQIDLEVPRGELFGFLGPNGAGKTTTLRMIAGILKPSGGSISIAGVDLAADPIGAKMRLGFIPDRPFIYEKLTGEEFLRFVAGLYDQEGAEVEHRARELMALFDLEEWRDELVESYSHGMRQKLIISSAFVHRPEVMVVDEPMVGLDPKATRILKDLFREYVKRGHTIMMSTHTLEVAETLCDRIAIIQQGKIRSVGTIQDLREEATGGGGLEEIFLKLTGERAARDAMEVLDA